MLGKALCESALSLCHLPAVVTAEHPYTKSKPEMLCGCVEVIVSKEAHRARATSEEAHGGALVLGRGQHLVQALAPGVQLPLLLPLFLLFLCSKKRISAPNQMVCTSRSMCSMLDL